MKKVALLTILLVVAASAAITFPNGAPSKVGEVVDVSIPLTGAYLLYVDSGGVNRTWVYPTSGPVSQIEITHPGTGMKLVAVGASTEESAPFDIVIGDEAKWQIIAPGEIAKEGDATEPDGKTGTARVTAGGDSTYDAYRCDKWYNHIDQAGSWTISVDPADDPYASVTNKNEVQLRRAGTTTVTIAGGSLASNTSEVNVVPDVANKLLILCSDSEVEDPGDNATGNYPGKTGEPNEASLGTPYKVTVIAVDACWNEADYDLGTVTVWDDGNNQIGTNAGGNFSRIAINDVDFGEVNPLGEYVTATESKGLQTTYATPVIVREGVDSIYAYLTKPTVTPGVTSSLMVELFIAGSHVPAGYPVIVDLDEASTTGDPSTFEGEGTIYTKPTGIADTMVTATAVGDYYIDVSSGNASTTVKLTVEELEDLRVRPNPYVYERHSALPISFDYKVEQIGTGGASEVKLLVADPYGNLVYTATYDIDETQTNPGQQTITWDGLNSKGVRVASGMYQAVLKITLINGSTSVLKKNLMVIW